MTIRNSVFAVFIKVVIGDKGIAILKDDRLQVVMIPCWFNSRFWFTYYIIEFAFGASNFPCSLFEDGAAYSSNIYRLHSTVEPVEHQPERNWKLIILLEIGGDDEFLA